MQILVAQKVGKVEDRPVFSHNTLGVGEREEENLI